MIHEKLFEGHVHWNALFKVAKLRKLYYWVKYWMPKFRSDSSFSFTLPGVLNIMPLWESFELVVRTSYDFHVMPCIPESISVGMAYYVAQQSQCRPDWLFISKSWLLEVLSWELCRLLFKISPACSCQAHSICSLKQHPNEPEKEESVSSIQE